MANLLNPGNNCHYLCTVCFADWASQNVFILVLLVAVCAIEHGEECQQSSRNFVNGNRKYSQTYLTCVRPYTNPKLAG